MIETIVHTLIQGARPFILSLSAPDAAVGDDLRHTIAGSGLGLVLSWCPQLSVLSHEATGCFVVRPTCNPRTSAAA